MLQKLTQYYIFRFLMFRSLRTVCILSRLGSIQQVKISEFVEF